ncbi:MAG: flagellar biosynthesis anti-sigma factor FlgM [bacterium]
MKIPEIGPGEFPQIKRTARAQPATPAAAPAPAHDTVEVGADALIINRLRGKLNDPAELDARVHEIRQQIAEGRYHPDAREIALRMLGQK